MGNVIAFPKQPVRSFSRGLVTLSTEDLQFQQIIREQSAELRARKLRIMPRFERFWALFHGNTDCGNPTGQPNP